MKKVLVCVFVILFVGNVFSQISYAECISEYDPYVHDEFIYVKGQYESIINSVVPEDEAINCHAFGLYVSMGENPCNSHYPSTKDCHVSAIDYYNANIANANPNSIWTEVENISEATHIFWWGNSNFTGRLAHTSIVSPFEDFPSNDIERWMVSYNAMGDDPALHTENIYRQMSGYYPQYFYYNDASFLSVDLENDLCFDITGLTRINLNTDYTYRANECAGCTYDWLTIAEMNVDPYSNPNPTIPYTYTTNQNELYLTCYEPGKITLKVTVRKGSYVESYTKDVFALSGPIALPKSVSLIDNGEVIQLCSNESNVKSNVKIINTMGQVVMNEEVHDLTEFKFNKKQLRQGIYILVVKSNEQLNLVEKIVVN